MEEAHLKMNNTLLRQKNVRLTSICSLNEKMKEIDLIGRKFHNNAMILKHFELLIKIILKN